MKRRIKIIIGIPAYNEEENIGKLLKNLLSQEGNNFLISKIVVVSDGSVDKTVEIVRSLQNKKIELIVHKRRQGQNATQNEIANIALKNDAYLLLSEADTLPASKDYISKLVSAIPEKEVFSIIVGKSIPLKPFSILGRAIYFGTLLRFEIFERSISHPNVYLHAENALFSPTFLKKIKWTNNYNEDSFTFRKALESGFPIIRVKNAQKYFKTVDNLKDYLLQSGKFVKAKKNEKKVSSIYNVEYDYIKAFQVLYKYFYAHNLYIALYFLLLFVSRIYQIILPNYSQYWQTYKSTKKV